MIRHRDLRSCVAAFAALACVGCVTPHHRPESRDDAALDACAAALYDDQRAAVRAGAIDGGRAIVPGFPHYRATRLLASFAADVNDDARVQEWTERLMAEAAAARHTEHQRRGAVAPPRLAACATRLRTADLQHPARLRALREAARVPDDYSRVARTFGAYPLARPFLRRGIAGYHQRVAERYATAIEDAGQRRDWAPEPPSPPVPVLQTRPRTSLGFPEISPDDWAALAAHHAPTWSIDVVSDDDLPGTPRRDADGRLRFTPEAVAYWYGDWTRRGDTVLPMLVYTVWFAARTAASRFDPYAGPIDGVVWRVILQEDVTPLGYDSIHPCGCYRYFFLAEPVVRLRQQDDPRRETIPVPQAAPLPRPPIAVWIAAGDHQVQRVRAATDVDPMTPRYRLVPYEQLEAGQLFGPEGLIAGSERGERWWLWPSGVISPGAMRQRGRQATAFIGRTHFDDPRFLDTLLEAD